MVTQEQVSVKTVPDMDTLTAKPHRLRLNTWRLLRYALEIEQIF